MDPSAFTFKKQENASSSLSSLAKPAVGNNPFSQKPGVEKVSFSSLFGTASRATKSERSSAEPEGRPPPNKPSAFGKPPVFGEKKFGEVSERPLGKRLKPIVEGLGGFDKSRMKWKAPPVQNPIKKQVFLSKNLPGGIDETDEAPTSLFGGNLATKPIKTIGSAPNIEEKPYGMKIPAQMSRISTMKRFSPAPRSFSPDLKNIGGNNEENKLIKKLLELKGRECSTEYDKYMLLDERDKILCQLRTANSSIISRIERCEEMCTEKERYMRIVQKRASPFECDEGTGEVSYDIMVKEYARSAADQERPLPHELRSEKMMDYTMSYLLHNVLDKFPESVDERGMWYNFLWSRTRAVRKEVTQLSLSDKLAINLVERCTRLHILFGYILCTLEIDHFDQKMNNENLGKCLQTLRHLYEDFERRGIYCENEAEFRSYDVMLHMSDTNVLSQVLSYPNEVRQSKHVCLALQLVSSYQNQNYCKFFRLLKQEATFLQCCVSHQWFDKMRANALWTMTRSYGTNAVYPLEKIQNILAYDTIKDAKNALNNFGLRVDVDQIVLNRDYLNTTDLPPMTTYQWIDMKKMGNFSQVVYGPETFIFYSSRCDVSNSFDYENRYMTDKMLEMILSNNPIESSSNNMTTSKSTGSLQATIEQKRKMDQERIERIREMEKKKTIEVVTKLSNNIIDDIVRSIADEACRKEAMMRRQERKMEEQKRMRIEMDRQKKERDDQVTRRIVEEVQNEIIEKVVKKLIKEEFKKERMKEEEKVAKKMTEKLWTKKIIKQIDNRVQQMCQEMMEDEKNIKEGLMEFKMNMKTRWIKQFWNRWREWVEKKKEKRERRHEMLLSKKPMWDRPDIESELVRKYVMVPSKKPESKYNEHFVRSTALQKRRKARISKEAIRKWRNYAKEKRMTRIMAMTMRKKEEEFFERFKNTSERVERRFTFTGPQDICSTSSSKKLRKDTSLTKMSFLEPEFTTRRPLKENVSFSVFSNMDKSFNTSDASFCVAKEQIEKGGWKGCDGMPKELKEKLKRRRLSLEAEMKDHEMKRQKNEDEMRGEVKIQNSKMCALTKDADDLLEETMRCNEKIQKLINELKLKKVDDL